MVCINSHPLIPAPSLVGGESPEKQGIVLMEFGENTIYGYNEITITKNQTTRIYRLPSG